ncbi:hypothetical protein CNBN0190 [Cryptococcus deneoformans B-3501A]|uniref:Uncharacterized protein n=1 Tax=Cryptococcus deneoformans (strain JEC21 / ATCC MYA-565) TaxID=214684 RepID=Q5K7D7_CRYD1|nr:hypothetical protein CNN00210 [Cryptococcus neoformans var. neoformans JEC21]XP_771837.1 hypothetical protein CNBN0190 [Cryptococcus neoformans var. neoformans B-3501A]AAW47012.1 hypothetical protein CNN00210 [Cryptococcus neoformans var. neoformans JEC21]EAL17190.1 hypothetical protein CNBN0190 [Cryptococcus neoformans var. neoformans B-3501A]
MRARVPSSVISTIESFNKPDFRPVATFKGLLDPPPTRGRGKTTHKTRPNKQLSKRTAANPASVPYLLRSSGLSPAQTIHNYFLSHPLPSPPSTSDVIQRQKLYSKFISSLLSSNSDTALSIIPDILRWSFEERVPITSITLTQILHRSLQSPDLSVRLSTVRNILPLLPDRLDIPLLDTLLRAFIRDSSPAAHHVHSIITDCLALENVDKDKGMGKGGWPWELWDVGMAAYVPKGDFKGAMEMLEEIKVVVQACLASPSSSATPPTLSARQKECLLRVYTTTLNTWRISTSTHSHSQGHMKLKSTVPRKLAEQLISFIGEPEGQAGMMFLNAWLRAERDAENWEVVEGIVEMMMDSSQELDCQTWTTIFNLYTTPALLPPLRVAVHHLLHQSPSDIWLPRSGPNTNSKGENSFPNPNRSLHFSLLTTDVITSIVRAVFYPAGMSIEEASARDELDLPLAVLILRLTSSTPERKLIDLLSSCIFHTAQTLSPLLPTLPPLSLSLSTPSSSSLSSHSIISALSRPSSSSLKFKGKGKARWVRLGMNKDEWDLVTGVVHRLRMVGKADQVGGKVGEDERIEVVHLPLSMPIARLATDSSPPSPSRPTISSKNEEAKSPSSSDDLTTTSLTRHPPSPTDSDSISALPERRQPITALILPQLIKLLETLAVVMHQCRAVSRDSKGKDGQRFKDDKDVLKEVMQEVNGEVMYPSRRERRIMKRERLPR